MIRVLHRHTPDHENPVNQEAPKLIPNGNFILAKLKMKNKILTLNPDIQSIQNSIQESSQTMLHSTFKKYIQHQTLRIQRHNLQYEMNQNIRVQDDYITCIGEILANQPKGDEIWKRFQIKQAQFET